MRRSVRIVKCLALAAFVLAAEGTSRAADRPAWTAEPASTPIVHANGHAQVIPLALPPTARSSFSRFYVHAADGIQAYQPGRPNPLWAKAYPTQRTPLLLEASDELAIFATGYEIFALDTRTGRDVWRWGAEPVGLEALGADPEDFPRQRYFAADGRRIIAVRTDGHAVCVDADSGETLWAHVLAHGPAGHVVVRDKVLAYVAVVDHKAAVCLCDATTGRGPRVLPSPGAQAVIGLMIAPEGRVILVTAGAVAAFDARTATSAWTHAAEQRLGADRVLRAGDALYVSPDGYAVYKLAVTDGRTVWRTPGARVGRADRVALAVYDERLVLASESEVTLLDGGNGRRLDHSQFDVGSEIDGWEMLTRRVVGWRRTGDASVRLRTFDPTDAAAFAVAAEQGYALPGGRIDNVAFFDGGLVLSGGGQVVSFAPAVADAPSGER